jgi:PAS domain S-box-containing protein
METKLLRKTGIEIVGDIPWGTHFCQFYETKNDLLDILIPYFKMGLENNEFCIWIVSEPFDEEEAKNVLKQAIPKADQHLAAGDIEILPHAQWYLKGGTFDPQSVNDSWREKLNHALSRGYDGMRVNGIAAWLTKNDWEDFAEYEKELNNVIADQKMIVLCTYPLAISGAAELLDVAHIHEFALARRNGKWDVIETPLKQAKEEVKRLQRGINRTSGQPLILSYLVAVLSVTAALIITLWIRMELGQPSTPIVALFLCAIMSSAWFGGVVPGLLATALSLLAIAYWFTTPIYSLAVDIREIPRLLIFALSALFVGCLSVAQRRGAESLRHARDILEGTVQELKRANETLQAENAERKQTERELRESQQQYESLVNSINGIIVEVNGQTLDATFVSKGAERILGYPVEQWLKEPNFWMTILHSEDHDWVVNSKLQSAIKIEDQQLEYRMIAADGHVIWFRDLLTVNVTRDNSIILRGVKIDITDRKRIEENLKQSERQLAEAQHIARIGSWNWDLQNDVITWSDELYQIFGLDPQEYNPTYDTVVMQYIHPEDQDLTRATLEHTLKTLEPFNFHKRIVHSDGEIRIINSRGNIDSDKDGKPIRMFGTIQDVTERKAAEEQLQSSNEKLRALAARLQAVREEESIRIAREIHDELGSALTGLKMDISWLDKRLPEKGSEALQQKFKAMSELIDETVQKVRNISTELRPAILDHLGLAAAIESQCREFQKRTEIKCRIISLSEETDLSAEKSTAVFRIFQEILTNVARHSDATLVEISMEKVDDELVLKVSDNGKGIKEVNISDTKSLGILGMLERAAVFGGQIEISGEEGKGTKVTVRIPHE